jgi:hypothetical protein
MYTRTELVAVTHCFFKHGYRCAPLVEAIAARHKRDEASFSVEEHALMTDALHTLSGRRKARIRKKGKVKLAFNRM